MTLHLNVRQLQAKAHGRGKGLLAHPVVTPSARASHGAGEAHPELD